MAFILSDEFSGRIELEFDDSCVEDLDLDIANPNKYRFSISRRDGQIDYLSLSVERDMNYDVVGTDALINNSRSQSIFWEISQLAKQLSGSRFSTGDELSHPDYSNFRLKVVEVSEEDRKVGYNTEIIFPNIGENFRLGEVGRYGMIGTTYALLKRLYYRFL